MTDNNPIARYDAFVVRAMEIMTEELHVAAVGRERALGRPLTPNEIREVSTPVLRKWFAPEYAAIEVSRDPDDASRLNVTVPPSIADQLRELASKEPPVDPNNDPRLGEILERARAK